MNNIFFYIMWMTGCVCVCASLTWVKDGARMHNGNKAMEAV